MNWNNCKTNMRNIGCDESHKETGVTLITLVTSTENSRSVSCYLRNSHWRKHLKISTDQEETSRYGKKARRKTPNTIFNQLAAESYTLSTARKLKKEHPTDLSA